MVAVEVGHPDCDGDITEPFPIEIPLLSLWPFDFFLAFNVGCALWPCDLIERPPLRFRPHVE